MPPEPTSNRGRLKVEDPVNRQQGLEESQSHTSRHFILTTVSRGSSKNTSHFLVPDAVSRSSNSNKKNSQKSSNKANNKRSPCRTQAYDHHGEESTHLNLSSKLKELGSKKVEYLKKTSNAFNYFHFPDFFFSATYHYGIFAIGR